MYLPAIIIIINSVQNSVHQITSGECKYKLSVVCDYESTITVHDYVVQS